MTRSGAPQLDPLHSTPPLFRTVVSMARAGWTYGRLTFLLPGGEPVVCNGVQPGPEAIVQVRDFGFVRRALAGGDVGFGEGYMAGEWDTPDLSAVLEGFAVNFDKVYELASGKPLVKLINSVGHWLKRNSRAGSRRNIHAHYDLGNDFYSRWLDPTMSYSSARYDMPGQPLDAAQRNKYASLAGLVDLQAGHSVLEIGCGWGGFAEFAAGEVGAKVTGITISKEQFDFARKRMFEAGLAEKADIRLIDYRDIEGQFDRIASIEMFEAVGEQYWPAYFSKVYSSLNPGGRAGLQIITIRDELFADYRSRADFIQKYIFPGGMLPSETRLRQETGQAGLEWREVIRFGQNYADTLAEWARRFEAAWHELRPMGFDERFRRLWRFYLSYCEAGFRTERTNVIQLGLSKPA